MVLITGCDTGFGRILAVRLAKKGFKVYAACLSDKGMEEIREEVLVGLLRALLTSYLTDSGTSAFPSAPPWSPSRWT